MGDTQTDIKILTKTIRLTGKS